MHVSYRHFPFCCCYGTHTHTQAEDILELLLTNGMQYDMACAMDYTYFRMYDMWVTRDLNVMHGGHHSDTQPSKALLAVVSPPSV